MKTTPHLLLFTIALGVCFLFDRQHCVVSAQSSVFTYQGQLQDSHGPANGLVDFEFRLFDEPASGQQIGLANNQAAVSVSNGLFVVSLDFGPTVFTGGARWLEISVRTNRNEVFNLLSPRQPLTPAPYAIFALNASNAGLASSVADGSITRDKIAEGAIVNANISASARIDADKIVGGDLQATRLQVGTSHTLGGEYGTIAGGYSNKVTQKYSVVSGGTGNTAAGQGATVSGGLLNLAANLVATVGGGTHNLALEAYSTVGGGEKNTAEGGYTTVAGGSENFAGDSFSSIGGGYGNRATNRYATVGGGESNTVTEMYATVSGGSGNTASGISSSVGGGNQNKSTGRWSNIGGGWRNATSNDYTTVSGGLYNSAEGPKSSVSGGDANHAKGESAAIGGGLLNMAMGDYATVPGGMGNSANGKCSFAAGGNASALHHATFVWGDSAMDPSPQIFASTGTNQFLIRARGGVGIGTAAPKGPVHILQTGIPPAGLDSWNNGLLLGIQKTDGYKWIQSYGGPLTLNPLGNNVGINKPDPATALDVNGVVTATTFAPSSDRNLKENLSSVQPREVLDKVVGLTVSCWNFKGEEATRHVGPMAQDFYEAFGLGADNKHIATVDADGVALAAIQGLNQKLETKNAALEKEITELRTLVRVLADKVNHTAH
jgi:trimeric autotransporter adhesin